MVFRRANTDPTCSSLRRRNAFTLIELLVVTGIIALLLGLVVPAFTGIRAGGDFAAAANDITSTFEQARAYAMANNTCVYVGVGEYLVTESSSASPRTAGIGQVVLAVVASRDGTRGYDVNNPSTTWSANYGNGSTLLTAIDKLHLYNNVHLADFNANAATPPPTGKMARPTLTNPVTNPGLYSLGSTLSSSNSSTPLSWPLGTTLTSGQYKFSKVIQIDPQGVARIQTDTNADGIAPYMELDLQPTHANVTPAPMPADQNVGNQAAVQIDCMTGATRVYRP